MTHAIEPGAPGPMTIQEVGDVTQSNTATIGPSGRSPHDHATAGARAGTTGSGRSGYAGMIAGVGRALAENARATLRDSISLPDETTRIGPETVVVITGASAGVGRATAQAFARRGARIGLIARGEAGLQGAKADVEALGGQAVVVSADVSDCDAVDRAASTTEAAFGPIDVWVNVAMASVFSPFADMEMADFRRVTEVTYLGYVWGTHAALKRMRSRDHGHIVQVGSALAYRGIPLQSAYCGAKHAIQGFTESVRTELIHDGSRVWVTMVQLPAVNTPQFDWVRSTLPDQAQPVPPIFQPEVPASAILWAAEHHRRTLNVGSSTDLAVYADKVAPGVLDHYLGDTGFASQQQTGQPEDPTRPNNLYAPLDEDRDVGAHGRFDSRATGASGQLWLAMHRDLVVSIGASVAVAWLGLRTVLTAARRRGSTP